MSISFVNEMTTILDYFRNTSSRIRTGHEKAGRVDVELNKVNTFEWEPTLANYLHLWRGLREYFNCINGTPMLFYSVILIGLIKSFFCCCCSNKIVMQLSGFVFISLINIIHGKRVQLNSFNSSKCETG